MQTAVYYEAVKSSCQQEPLKSLLDPSWAQLAEFQAGALRGAAEFWQSVSVKETALEKGSGYAEEISRLQRAEAILTQTVNFGKRCKLNLGSLSSGEALLKTITNAKTKAIHDNNSIYMESVPADSSLVPIIPVSMVKPASVPEYQTSEVPFFQNILPSRVRQIRGEFQNKIEEILTKAASVAGAASNSGRVTLSALGLPGSLESYKSGGKLPDNLWVKIQRIQTLGGKNELMLKLTELENSANRALQTMGIIQDSLLREERLDSSFRTQYPQWKNQSSSPLINEMKAHLMQLRDTFEQAKVSDDFARNELNDPEFYKGLSMLAMPYDNISKLFPKPTPTADLLDFDNSSQSINTSILERKLMDMAILIDNRSKALEKIQNIANSDISDELLSIITMKGEHASEINDLVSKYIDASNEHVNMIQRSIEQQPSLLKEITDANLAFQQAYSQSVLSRETNAVILNLEKNVTRYFNLHAQLLAGSTFYSNFQVTNKPLKYVM
jgi:hypothetical protein